MLATPLIVYTDRKPPGNLLISTYYEVCVPHYVIGYIPLYQEIMDSVSRNGSVEGMMDGAMSDVGAIHAATQVEVYGVSTQSEGLPAMTNLSMLDSNVTALHDLQCYSVVASCLPDRCGVRTHPVDEYLCSILICTLTFNGSLNNHIMRQQTNFSSVCV